MIRLSPAQIRGARGMLDWSMLDLAQAARVSVSTVKRMEKGETLPLTDAICATVRDAFEAAGIRFIDDDDGRGTGLRLEPGRSGPDAARHGARADDGP